MRDQIPTYICTVFHQQLCAGVMSLYTGSMEGRNHVQSVQIDTSALWAQHSHYRFGSKTKYPHWRHTMRYEFVTHDNMNPYLCNESLQGEDSTVKGGIMNGRPVWFNIWLQKQRGLSQRYSGSIHLQVMVKLPPVGGSEMQRALPAETHRSSKGWRRTLRPHLGM